MSPTITALTAQKRNPQRINVYLDGEFAFGVARIVAAWLVVGQELSPEKIRELQAQDENEVALQRAVSFLSFRPRTAREVRQNLEKHGVSADAIEQVIARLERNGLLNDREFARLWIENRSEFRPRGRRALEFELRSRGVADKVITEVLAESLDDEEMLAYEAAQKYTRKLSGLEDAEFRRKLGGFLARRGFDYEVTSQVVARIWQEQSEALQAADDYANENEVN
jgi:regulatory protein